jgi:hypothetical protein
MANIVRQKRESYVQLDGEQDRGNDSRECFLVRIHCSLPRILCRRPKPMAEGSGVLSLRCDCHEPNSGPLGQVGNEIA